MNIKILNSAILFLNELSKDYPFTTNITNLISIELLNVIPIIIKILLILFLVEFLY